ncbi:MAG TPA: FHA domain-containing protein [Aggregatilineales bacterium]|nr:FHA domain-containing protein [Anaerolineae bacterium]HUN05470.1 FHA domain-containing protein [Aggregatilineales bacterium]
MPLDVVLFILRLVSSLLLLGLLVSLFVIMWWDFRSIALPPVTGRRVYGQLVRVENVDGQHMKTGIQHELLPLTSLGRSPTNSVVVEDTFASGDHALIAMRGGRWWLEDRGSRNGTLLNDIPVHGPMILTHGDIIGIGAVKLRLELLDDYTTKEQRIL